MIAIYSRTPDPGTVDQAVLSHFFTSEKGNNDTTFYHRKVNGPTRGVMRLLFPKFLLKLKEHNGRPRYRLKPDALATFMFVVFVVVGITWQVDPESTEGTPPWLPLVFAGWFVVRAINEVMKTKAALDRATSGQPLEQAPPSDLVAQVIAQLDAEQSEPGDEQDETHQ